MKFSEAWLREWVSPDLERTEFLQQLTMAGLEVEGAEPVAETFSGVVVGVIEQCDKHSDADKLVVCQVSDGSGARARTVQVVCGAPNARVGLVTAFAKVGALLPGDFKIKKAKLRGVESFGMLCSAQELGLGDDHEGIMDLPTHWQAGDDLAEVMQLGDVTVDLDLTPNRGDCLSLKGIAREVGVLNNLAVDYPQIEAVAPASNEEFAVSIDNGASCPRYLGRVIKGVDLTRPTPFWIQERLRRCGLRSIDPIVDVTNYVLLELGQPMHAFDLNQLNDAIVVRDARPGELLTLLGGQDVELDAETLLITDAKGPLAIAGVMGGERSGVQADTNDVFLECAFFAPLAIAGTARRYGLHTDASLRYERGVDFGLQSDAIERATQMLIDIVGGEPGPVVVTESAEHLPQINEVRLRETRLRELLGVDISPGQVDEAFARLGFAVQERLTSEAGVEWLVSSPTHRFDIAIEADLVEEVCRIYGYNNIPVKHPMTDLTLSTVSLESHPEAELKRCMALAGFQELVTYSFVDPQLLDLLDPGANPLTLANPMSSEQSVMRTNLLPGLIHAAQSNRARQQDAMKLFELGLVFQPGVGGLVQTSWLGGLLWGRRELESWHGGDGQVDFFDVKGEVDALLAWAGHEDVKFTPAQDRVLHPGQNADIWVNGERVGRVGRLHPEVESRLEFVGVYVFEIRATTALVRPLRRHVGVSKFPSVRRDLAVVVGQDVASQDVNKVVKEVLGEILVDFTLFDVYEGKGVDSTEKSLGIGLTLQSQTATLTEQEISEYAQSALNELEGKFGARLR